MGLSLSALTFRNLVLKTNKFPLDLFGLEVRKSASLKLPSSVELKTRIPYTNQGSNMEATNEDSQKKKKFQRLSLVDQPRTFRDHFCP